MMEKVRHQDDGDLVVEESIATGKVRMPKKKKMRIDHKEVQEKAKHSTAETPKYELQNVVATFNLGVDELDLKTLCLNKPFLEYNPQKFAAATLRIRHPRTTALAFASGNMVCTGGKTQLQARLASRKYVRLLQKHHVPVSFRDFAIQNIVASADVKTALRLRELAADYGCFVSYEPELFPGLVFRTTFPKLVFLLFRSGKIVITGAKSCEEIEETFDAIYKGIISNYVEEDATVKSSAEYQVQMRQSILPLSAFDV